MKQKERPTRVRREDGILVDTTLEDLCHKLNIICFRNDGKCIATISSGYRCKLSKLSDYFTKEQVLDIITLSMFKPTYKFKDSFKTTWRDFYIKFFKLEKNIWTDAVLDYIEADSYFSSIALATSPYEMVHTMIELLFETVDTLNSPQFSGDVQEVIKHASLLVGIDNLYHLGKYASGDNTYTGYIDVHPTDFSLQADKEDNVISAYPALKIPRRIAKLLDLPTYKSGYGLILLNFIEYYNINENTTDEEIKEYVKNFENHRENLKSTCIDLDTQDALRIAYAYY